MEGERKKRRGGLVALIVIVLLLAAVCAAPFIHNAATHFAYEDYEKLAEGWEQLFFLSASEDGEHLLFHMDRNSFYRLMIDNDVLAAVEEETGGRVKVERIGYLFRAGENELDVCAAVKAFALKKPSASNSRRSFHHSMTGAKCSSFMGFVLEKCL